MAGGWKEKHLPTLAMVAVQCVIATATLLTRAALVKGMSPIVFIFYRQAIATFVISPVAFFTRNSSSSSMGVKNFLLIFLAAFIGAVLNQALFFEGLYLASASIGSAMNNMIPAATFIIAAIVRVENVNPKRLSTMAKILGTTICVGGAISMALIKGPKLLSVSSSLVFQSLNSDVWLLGCLCLFASTLCFSAWLILQVPITRSYPNTISLTSWLCFLATLQAGAIALVFERDLKAWILDSPLELTCCFFSGIFMSGFQFFALSWCVSKRGPVFTAMFNPLATIITAAIACIFLDESMYLGSLIGAIAVIIGLYIVLWGKSEELKAVLQEDESHRTSCYAHLEQPLLTD